MIKRLFKNTYFLTLFVKVASLGMSIISGALLARFLGPALKGQLASLESVAQVISVLMNFGIYHLYPKMVKDNLSNARQKFINVFFFQLIIYISIVIFLYFTSGNIIIIYYGFIAIVSCLVSQLTMMCMVEFPVYRSISLLVVSVSNLLITIIIFFSDIAHVLLVPVLVYLLKDILFCILIMLRFRIFPRPYQIDWNLLRILIKSGFVPMITALLLKLNYRVDVIMLNLFKIENETIGVYSVAISIATQLWIIPEAFKEVLYSKSTERNPEKSFVSALKVSTYSLLILDMVIIVLGYWVILILYGKLFIGANSLLSILVIGVPFMGVFNIVNPYYLSMGQYNIHLENLSLGVISNIIANSLLIIPFGAKGAAVATCISQVVCGIYACYQFSKSSSISVKEIILINKMDLKFIEHIIRKRIRV